MKDRRFFSSIFDAMHALGAKKLYWINRASYALIACACLFFNKNGENYSFEIAAFCFGSAVLPFEWLVNWTFKSRRFFLLLAVVLGLPTLCAVVSHGLFTGRWSESLWWLLIAIPLIAWTSLYYHRTIQKALEKYADK